MKYATKAVSFVNCTRHLARTSLNRSAPSEVTYKTVAFFEAFRIHTYTVKGSLQELLV
jgi:hypothetical protein